MRKDKGGITLFAILILLISICMVLLWSPIFLPQAQNSIRITTMQQLEDTPIYIPSIYRQEAADKTVKDLRNTAIRMTIYSAFIFIGGIAILLRRNWGRVVLISVLFIAFISNIVGLPIDIFMRKALVDSSIVPFIILSSLILLMPLVYLTRPKVKEQFK